MNEAEKVGCLRVRIAALEDAASTLWRALYDDENSPIHADDADSDPVAKAAYHLWMVLTAPDRADWPQELLDQLDL